MSEPDPPPDRQVADPRDPTAVLPDGWSRRTKLRDGTRVLLRQIRAADRERLARGVQELSPASRYLRFRRNLERLSDEQLTYLTEVDHHDHEAIVALDLEHLDRPGVGVARYIREPFEPQVAEAAVTVADAYHGQGAGTMLLGALAGRARAEGIETFRNYVLDGNHGMLELFDHLGAQRALETDGLWRVDLPLPTGEDDVPDAPTGRAFLAMAQEDRTLASLVPPIWSRWRRRDEQRDVAEDDEGRRGPYPEVVAAELRALRVQLEDWLRRRRTP